MESPFSCHLLQKISNTHISYFWDEDISHSNWSKTAKKILIKEVHEKTKPDLCQNWPIKKTLIFFHWRDLSHIKSVYEKTKPDLCQKWQLKKGLNTNILNIFVENIYHCHIKSVHENNHPSLWSENQYFQQR